MPQDHRHLTDEEILTGLDGELSDDQLRRFVADLSACPTCQARTATLEDTSQRLRACVQADTPPAAFRHAAWARARLGAALQEEARRPQPRLAQLVPAWSSPIGWRAIAASLIVALSLGALFGGELGIATPSVSRLAEPLARVALPVPALTPGAWAPVQLEEICAGTARTPAIPEPVRQQVLANYGMEHVPADQYELDYLVTPELGGVPDPRNLWPQRYAVEPWNALVKDELEQLLSTLVCSGRLELRSAQVDMATDWVAAYRKYFRTRGPRTHLGRRGDEDGNADLQVSLARPRPVS